METDRIVMRGSRGGWRAGESPPPPEIVFGSAQDCVFFFTMMQWQMCHGYFTCFLIVKVLYTEGPLNGLIHFSANYAVTNRVFWCDKQCKNGNSNNCVCKSEVQTPWRLLHSLTLKKRKLANCFLVKYLRNFDYTFIQITCNI